jgi:hypothetical protein
MHSFVFFGKSTNNTGYTHIFIHDALSTVYFNRFEASVRMVLSQEEIDGCREAFLAFDRDRSGTIDVWELRQVSCVSTYMMCLSVSMHAHERIWLYSMCAGTRGNGSEADRGRALSDDQRGAAHGDLDMQQKLCEYERAYPV